MTLTTSWFHLCPCQVWCRLSDGGVQRRHGDPGLQPDSPTLHLPVWPAAVQLRRCPPNITAHLPLSWLHEGTGGVVQRLPIAASRHQWGWQDWGCWINMTAASRSMWGSTHRSVLKIDHIYCFLAAAWNRVFHQQQRDSSSRQQKLHAAMLASRSCVITRSCLSAAPEQQRDSKYPHQPKLGPERFIFR